MKTNFAKLDSICQKLSQINGIKTCSIGIEANITADDYPIIRIVPSVLHSVEQTPSLKVMEVLIYYGEKILTADKEGLKAKYEWLLNMEQQIQDTLEIGNDWLVEWKNTILDEDRIPGFKLFASCFLVH